MFVTLGDIISFFFFGAQAFVIIMGILIVVFHSSCGFWVDAIFGLFFPWLIKGEGRGEGELV